MKICIITSGHDVYDSRIYYKEILSLKEKYNEIYMVAPGEKDFTTKEGIIVKCFKKRNSQLDRFRVMDDIYSIAKNINADLYHAHEPDSLQVAVKLKKALNCKIIYDSHEYHPEGFAEHFSFGGSLVTKAVYIYERRLAKQADYIITVNDLLVNKFKKYNKNVVFLPNYPVLDSTEINKEYGEKPSFVYLGGLSEDRGIVKILESIKLIDEDYKYMFIGGFSDENFENRVKSYVSENLKDKDITFTGKIPHKDVFNYLEKSLAGFVLLQPNNWRYVNSEPIKLFEYMMSKTAVIGGDYPMIKNVIGNEECGLLAKSDDPKSIASAIKRLGKDPSIAKSMGEKGRIEAEEKYNWNIIKENLIETYENIERSLV